MATMELTEQERELLESYRTMDADLQNSTLEVVKMTAHGWRKFSEEVEEAAA